MTQEMAHLFPHSYYWVQYWAHSSTLAWKIPWMEEPGRLQSMGSLRVRHDWATSLSLFTFMHWGRKWQPTLVFLRGESQGQGSLVGCHLWGRTVGHYWSDLAAAAAGLRHVFINQNRNHYNLHIFANEKQCKNLCFRICWTFGKHFLYAAGCGSISLQKFFERLEEVVVGWWEVR